MMMLRKSIAVLLVALLAEGVDRNIDVRSRRLLGDVALLAEGVDRNVISSAPFSPAMVALLAEGVDRNTLQGRIA